jgi:hypothetical protein
MKYMKNIDLKKSMKSSKSKSYSSYKEFKKGIPFGGCKTNNKLTIFENTKIGAKGQQPCRHM